MTTSNYDAEYQRQYYLANREKKLAEAKAKYVPKPRKVKTAEEIEKQRAARQEAQQKYRLENRDRINARRRERYKNNPEQVHECSRRWRKKNLPRLAAYQKEYQGRLRLPIRTIPNAKVRIQPE